MFRLNLIFGLCFCALLGVGVNSSDSGAFDPETTRVVDEASQLLADNILNKLSSDPETFLRAEAWKSVERKIGDMFLQGSEEEFLLKDVVFKGLSEVSLDDITPDLMDRSIKFQARWPIVVLEGSVEGNERILITLENVGIKGVAAFIFENDSPVVKNLDARLSYGNLIAQGSESNDVMSSVKSQIEAQMPDYLENQISEVLNEEIVAFLNSLLSSSSLESLFNHNADASMRYRSAITARDNQTNKVIDYILALLTAYFKEQGYQRIPIPEVHETYKKKVGFIKVKGSFDATNGYVEDATSLQRTGDFALQGSWDGPEFTVYGSLGFGKLHARYDHYKAKFAGIKISGHIDVSINKNSVYFKISGKYTSNNVIHINSYEIKVTQFDDIKVKANGMGGALNWLLNKALNTVANRMKDKVARKIESSAREAIDKKLNKINWDIPINF